MHMDISQLLIGPVTRSSSLQLIRNLANHESVLILRLATNAWDAFAYGPKRS